MTTITNYGDLKDAVADYLDRTDLTARIPTFIQLAEAAINARFTNRQLESTSTLTGSVGSHTIALPTGFRTPLNMWLLWAGSAGTQDMRALSREGMAITTVDSIPQSWCIDGDTIYFNCPVSSASDYSFLFRWAGALGLSADADTNLVLANYPNVYLFGALKEAAPFLRDPEALQMWEAKFGAALDEAVAREGKNKGLVTLSSETGLLATRRPGFNVYRGY